MILCVGSVKGGVGKSTLASNLAVALSAGVMASVLVIDGDAQGTSALFAEARAERLEDAGYACVRARDLEVRTQVNAMRGKFDHILIDAGGQKNRALAAALSVCRRVLVPVPPRSADVWTTDMITDMVGDARISNPGLQVSFAVNLAFPRGADNSEALSYLRANFPRADIASVPIVSRKTWSDGLGVGRSVIEAPRDSKAIAELDALVEHLTSLEDA